MNNKPKDWEIGPKNTLHLSASEVERLGAELDAQTPTGGSTKRKYTRWPFRMESVLCELAEPSGGMRGLHFAARDLSSTGISLLHSAYVHVQVRCVVHLVHAGSGLVTPVSGVVTRCRHVRGSVHEFAVRFAKPIEARSYLRIDPFEGCFTLENVDPGKLTGAVLHIEDSLTDRAMVRHFLRNTGLTVTSAETGAAGIERASEPYDLILCAAELGDMEGLKVVEAIRRAEVQTPVVVLSADLASPFRERVKAARANAFLSKPPSEVQLLRAVAEFLLMGGTGNDGGGALYSSLSATDPCAELVQDYVTELRAFAKVISKAIDADDAATAGRVCLKLMGASGALGFEPIAEAAEVAHRAVTASSSASESRKSLIALAGLCQRARTRGAARKAA